MGSERPIAGAYAGHQGPYFPQGMAPGPMQGQARVSHPAPAPSQPPIPLFITPSEPPRPPTSVGEGSVPQFLPDPLLTPTPTQPAGGGEIKPSGPAPGGPAPTPIIPAQDGKQLLPDSLSGRGPRTDEVQVLPQPTPPQPNDRQVMEEKFRQLEVLLTRLTSAERKSSPSNLFQNPAGPEYKVGQSLFRKPTPVLSGPADIYAQPLPDRPREGRSGSVDDRLAKKWMSEVKTFNPARESFRAWLVRAELRMEDGWDVGMRLNYLKSKLEPNEIVKLDQIIQLMDTQGTPRSWQAIRERALQVFPGAIDPDAAEFKLLAQHQDTGEPFGKWADRVTELYIEMAGEIPQPGLLDEVVFNGLRIEYKLEWRAMQPHNLLDARWRFMQLEQKKWQELGIPNPAEVGSGAAHLATSGGVPIHPDRADRVRDQPSAVFTAAESKGQNPDGHTDNKPEARPPPQQQTSRSPRKGRRGFPRKPGGDRDGEERRSPRERPPRRDFDGPSEQRESRGRQYHRSEWSRPERAGQRSPIKGTRYRQRNDRDDRARRNEPSRSDWERPPRRMDQSSGWRQPMGRGRPIMAAGQRQQFPAACGFCGRFGHVMRDCRDVECYNCGGRGHVTTRCRKPQMGRQQNGHQPQSGGGIPAYAITPDVREDNGGARQDVRGQATPGGVPGSQRNAIDEATRAAKILTDHLQNLAGQKFAPIFPL